MQTQELKNGKKKNDEELKNVKDSIMSSLEKDKGSFKSRLNHIDFREQELDRQESEIREEIVISKFTELTNNRSNTTEGSSVQINEELTSTVKNKHQHIHLRPRSSSWSSPFSNSRSISLSILQPLSPERSRYNHRDRNNIEVQQATFGTSDSTPNNDFSTNTTNYMRDNNIGKKTDTVP